MYLVVGGAGYWNNEESGEMAWLSLTGALLGWTGDGKAEVDGHGQEEKQEMEERNGLKIAFV